MTYEEWVKQPPRDDTDFMGAPKDFSNKNARIQIKAYQVKGHETIYSQTYTKDAQNTVKLVSDAFEDIPQLKNVSEIVVAKDLPGIAAYDHVRNRLYVYEGISNAEYIQEQLSNGYFAAENAEDILRHEMHHKDHWDKIAKTALTTGKSRDIVKQELEADLMRYVKEREYEHPAYIRGTVSENAENGMFDKSHTLNELIADTLLLHDKGIVRDSTLFEFVRRCVV